MDMELILRHGRFQELLVDPYRTKAASLPIEGPYKDGARLVRHILGWEESEDRPYLSTRNAQHKTGISNGTINTLAHGGKVSSNTIEIFAQKMGEDAERLKRLFGYISPEEIAIASDPLARIGPDVDITAIAAIPFSPFLVSAGDGFQVNDTDVEYETLQSVLPGEVRAIRVTGDCMEPLYHDGDVVFVREQASAENGNKVVALVDGDHLNCKVYRTNGVAYLEPKNGEGRISPDRFRIIGVIVGVFRKED